jgi:two-component system sensor histidine kinase YesM
MRISMADRRRLALRARLRSFVGSLRFKLLISHMALAILPLALASLVFYLFLVDEVQRKVSDSTLDRLAVASAVIDQRVGYVLGFVDDFMSSEDVNKILSRNFQGYSYSDVNAISDALAKGLESGSVVRSIILATKTGHVYRKGNWESIDIQAVMNGLLNESSKNVDTSPAIRWLGVHRSSSVTASGEYVIPLVGVLKHFTDFSDLGILYVEISAKGLYDFGASEGPGRFTYLVDSRGLVLASSDPDSASKNISELGFDATRFGSSSGYFRSRINEEDGLVSYFTSASTGWKVIEYRSFSLLLPEAAYFKEFFFLSVVLLAILVGILSLLISSRISMPIVKLSALMWRVDEGELDVSIQVEGNDEIRRLSESFNSMVQRLRESIERIYEQEKAKKKIEFEALQAQINPHFLYNTLGSIQWMAIIHELPSIADMTASLAKLLKLSLASPNPMIELEKEVDMLLQYIHILNVRYNNSIVFVYSIDPGLESIPVPRLLLQPLVENAIIHGMKENGREGRIELMCEREDMDLVLSVRDGGTGLSADRLRAILAGGQSIEDLANAQYEKGQGLGLKNVNKRIQLYYGEAYGLSVREDSCAGTTIIARIPIEISTSGR